jgi:hypothetical protein
MFRMPVRPPSRAEWVPDTTSDRCVYCSQEFTLVSTTVHSLGFETEIRSLDQCNELFN